jgi:hypothetical protein
MEQVKKTDKNLIFKKKSGRYAVKDTNTKKWINGDAKAEILLAEGLIEFAEPKPPAASDATEEAPETAAEEAQPN